MPRLKHACIRLKNKEMWGGLAGWRVGELVD
jgi:hypothetical protein